MIHPSLFPSNNIRWSIQIHAHATLLLSPLNDRQAEGFLITVATQISVLTLFKMYSISLSTAHYPMLRASLCYI
jgi:hypothetical protein